MNRFDSISQNSRKLVMRAWSDHKLRRRIEVVSALVLLVNIAIFGSAFYFQSKSRPIEAAPTEESSDSTTSKDMTKIEQNRARSRQKVTDLKNGQYQVEFHSVPVQYLDQSTGSWNDIDTNIKAMIGNQKDSAEKVSGQKDKAIVVDEDNLSSSFSTNPAGDLVMTTDTGTITNAYLGVSDSVGVISKNSILYADAYTSTDIERIFSPGKVKQNIIFKERGHPRVIQEKLDTSFRVEIQADNSIKYFDGSEVVATTPPIFLMDADGARREVSLRYDNKTLEITLPAKGLKRLTYPLVLDPTTTLYVADTNDDGYIAKAVSNYGSVLYTTTTNDDTIYAGPGYDCTTYNTACWRGFVRFAIPGVSGTINSATVYFRNWGSTASGYMDHMDPFDLTGESASTLWNRYYHARETVTWTQNTYVGTTWTSHVQEDVNNSRAYTYIGIKAASGIKLNLYSWYYTPYITITYTPVTYTMSTSVASGSGTVSGAGTYTSGDTATVTANPSTGWRFSSWGGNCAGGAQTAYVTMNGNKSCSANFTRITYVMDAYVEEGNGSVTGGGTYYPGETATATAYPDSGWQFQSWYGDCTGLGNPASVTMTAYRNCGATFVLNPTYTMSTGVNSGSGSVGGAGTYNSGDTATVTAYPSSRYGFNYWDGDCAGQGQTAYVGMNGNKSCSANFYFINSAPPMSTPSSPNNGAATRGDGTNQTFTTNGVSDPDGDTVYYYFRVATGSDAETGAVCNSGWQTSTSYTCNPGQGTRYWHVYTYDGYAQTNPNYVWSFLFDTVVPTYNSTAFQNCNYTSGSNCYVKNGQTFYVLMSHSDALSGAGTQYLELSKNGANRGTWDGATGNIKSYASLYGVSNSGYSPSFTDGAGMTGAGYLDIQNAQCIQAGNCNSTAYSKWQIVASSGASTAYGVTVYMYDQASNGVGYTDTGMWVYLDNSGPTINVTDGANASWNTSDTITVTSTDGASGAASTYYGFSADATCNASDTYGTSGLTLNVTTNHTDYVCFKSTDNVGNISYSTAIGPLHVDSSAPPAPTLTCTNYTNNTWTNSGATTVCSINDTATPSPRTAVAYSTNNGGSWTDNANALSMSAFTPAEGTTNVIMRISDTGGGPTSSNTYVIKRDSSAPPAPTLTCTNYTSGTWQNTNPATSCSINDSATPSTRTAVAYSTNGGGSWTDNANGLSFGFTPTANTSTSVIMRISDTGGGPTSSNTYVLRPDTSGPTINVTDGANASWNTSDTITVTSTDGASGAASTYYGFSADATCNASDTYGTSGLTLNVTTNHTDYVCFKSTDNVGNISYSTAIGPLKVDATAPTTSGAITGGTAGTNGWYTSNVTYTITPADASSGVASTVYCTDTAGSCTPGTTYSTALTISAESATNHVRFRSTDNAGNVQGIQDSGVIKIDKTTPTAVSVTSSGTPTNQNNFTVYANTVTDSLSGVSYVRFPTWTTYNGQDDLGLWPTGTNSGGSNWNYTVLQADHLGETGEYNTHVYAVDLAGNQGYVGGVNVVIDQTAPTTSGAITAGTIGSNGWYTTNVTYTITPADAGSGVASTVYCTDTAGSCTPGTTYSTALTISTESATNHVRFRSTDNAGNVQGIQDSGVIKIDKTNPTTTGAITAGTAGSNGWYTSNVTYTITPADATSGPAITAYCADTTNACTPGTTYSTALTISTESATNYIRFRTTDNAGLVQAIQSSGAIKIDKSAPTGSFAINNLHSNTSFESGSDGSLPSSFSNYNGTFEKSSTTYFTGSASGKLTANDPTYGSARAFQDYGGASIGETYTGSIYVKGNGTTIGKTFYLWLYEYNGSSWISTSQSVTLSSAWSRLSVSRTVTNLNSPNSGVVRTEFGFDRTVSGEYVYVDDIQLEKKSSASAYNAWSGSTNTNILYTSSTDALSGASQMLFSNDGSTWSSAESYATTKTSYDLTALGGGAGDGTKTVRVKFRDSAGNDSSVYTQSIILDTANPGSFSLLTPSDWSWTTSKRPTLDWGDSTEANLWKYEIYVDAALKKTIEVGSPASTWTLDYDLSEGSHPWYITATDFTGKTYSTFAGFFTVQVDSLKPSSAITAPTGGAYITTSSYNVTGTASNGGSGSAVDHVDISTNGGLGYSVATGTTAWSYTWTTGSDGSYNLKSRATDVAGNVETVGAGTTVIVDRTAVASGTVNDGVGADATWTKSTTSLSANWNGFTDANGIGKYKYAIGTTAGGTNIVGWTDNGLTTTATVNSLSLSSGQIYYFTVKAYDGTLAESNTRIVNSNGITVDTGLPTSAVTIASTYYGPNTWGASTINGTASDAISGIQKTEITIQRSSDSLYWTGSTWGSSTLLNVGNGSTWSYNLASGNLSDNVTYTVTSKATDNATNAQTALGSDTFIYDKSNTTPTVNVGVNLLSDSSWEGGGAGGWNYQYGTQGSGANASDKYYGGTKSYKVTRTVAGSEANIYRSMSSTTLKPSTTYYFSVFAWSDTANTACAFSALGSANLSMTCHAGSGKWERLGGTITTDSAGVIQLRLGHQSSTLSSVWFDQVQLEEGVSATTYVNDGYVNAAQWTTTAISGTAADAISGIQKTELTIQRSSDSLYWTGSTWGSSTWLNTGSGATWSYGSGGMAASNLTSGLTYTIIAMTTDNVNNASSAVTDTFVYDNTAPTSAVTAPPAYASASTYDSTGGAGNTIRGTAGDTGGSGISRTEITLQRADNSQYWTGSAWGTSTSLWVGSGAAWNYTALTSVSLTSGVLYRINATTYDQANNSTGATQQTFTYDTAAPTGGSITYTDGNYSTASVALTVSDGTDNGLSGINTGSRIVQRKSTTLTAGSCGSYGSFGTITTSGTYPNLVDTSVSNANCYQYQYLVSDNVGNQATYVGTTTAQIDTALPTVPTALTLASITASSINVSWTAASDGGTGLANPAYYIERAPDSSGNPGTWAQIATTNATSYRDSGLNANTKYYYRVRAKDTAGNYSGYSGEMNVDGNTVGLWHLNEGGSSSTTADGSSYGNTGTLNIGGTGTQTTNTQAWTNGVNGKLGQSLSLDGTDDSVSIPHSSVLKPSSQITISAWVKPTDITTNLYYEIYRKEDGADRQLFGFQDHGTTLSFGLGTATQGYQELDVSINASNYTDGWHLITATYDGSNKYLYRDGVQIGTQVATGAIGITGTANAYIGSWSGAGEYFKGQIDEVSVSNTARSGADISNYYAESNPQPKGAFTLPNAPTALTLTAASTSQINASWTASTGGTDHYHLYSSSNNYASPIYNSTGVSTSQSGLSSNTQYTYRLYAVNADGLESSMAGELNADANTVGLWHLNEGTGGTTVDSSGNGNIGTLSIGSGGTQATNTQAWTNGASGKFGSSLNFDGTDDYVNLSTAPTTGTGSFSVFAWVKTSSTGTRKSIVSYGAGGTTNQALYLFVNTSNRVQLDLANVSGPSSTTTVTDGAWHYVGVVNNAGSFQIYVDGVASGSPQSMSPNIGNAYAKIGGDSAGYYFNGQIDEVQVSNVARSAADISNYYTESNPYPRSRYTLANTPVLATPTSPTSNNRPTVSAAVAYDAALSNATIRLYDNGTLKATTTANSPLGDFSFTSGTYGANTLADGNHTNITARSVNGDGIESPDSGAKTILVDTAAPTGGTVNDGTGVDQDWNNGALNSLSANWSGFTDGTSGLQKYEYSIRRKPDDYYWNTSTNVWQSGASWYNNALTTTVTVSPVYLQTSTIYYISVRATDLAGNTASPVSSNGQRVTPNLTFSINTNAMTFANLNAGNGNTDSKTVTTTTTTNASGGYSAYIYEPNLLTSIPYPAKTIPNYAGTWAVPTTWSGYGFGYTSSDALVQGSNRFNSGTKYAGFASTAPGNIFADNVGPVNGQTGSITNEQFTLTGKVAVSGTQVASAYATNLLVLVTANY